MGYDKIRDHAQAGAECIVSADSSCLMHQQGAGSAGIGIANLLVAAMGMKGLWKEVARSRISMFDINGLLEPTRADLSGARQVYAHKVAPSKDLVEAIETLKPTVLIGVSTKGGAFNRRVVE